MVSNQIKLFRFSEKSKQEHSKKSLTEKLESANTTGLTYNIYGVESGIGSHETLMEKEVLSLVLLLYKLNKSSTSKCSIPPI